MYRILLVILQRDGDFTLMVVFIKKLLLNENVYNGCNIFNVLHNKDSSMCKYTIF